MAVSLIYTRLDIYLFCILVRDTSLSPLRLWLCC